MTLSGMLESLLRPFRSRMKVIHETAIHWYVMDLNDEIHIIKKESI